MRHRGSGSQPEGLRGAETVCVDLTRAAVARNRALHPGATACQADVLNLPFSDGAFDHCVSIGVSTTPTADAASSNRRGSPRRLAGLWCCSTRRERLTILPYIRLTGGLRRRTSAGALTGSRTGACAGSAC